jgi:hypothetical protein
MKRRRPSLMPVEGLMSHRSPFAEALLQSLRAGRCLVELLSSCGV